ncbi:hypothetical protein LINPERPRIM_LOCUS35940 [Linum perenne]
MTIASMLTACFALARWPVSKSRISQHHHSRQVLKQHGPLSLSSRIQSLKPCSSHPPSFQFLPFLVSVMSTYNPRRVTTKRSVTQVAMATPSIPLALQSKMFTGTWNTNPRAELSSIGTVTHCELKYDFKGQRNEMINKSGRR